MAGLPQDRPIPGSPLLDPLGQAAPPILPVAPEPPSGIPMAPQLPDTDPLSGLPVEAAPPAPQGYQFDASGQPLPWPPEQWFASPDGQPPAAGVQGHDVPEVPGGNALAMQHQPQAQGAPQGQVGVVAPAQGHPAATPAARPSTGDPYLDRIAEADDVETRAAVQKGQAEVDRNDYLREQGMQAAKDTADRQAFADAEYAKADAEATKKRAVLDQEAQDIAKQKIDPNRVWHNMSFGSQMFVAIAAGLSGMTTHSVQTGQNPVLTAMNQMTERDIAAQQADLDNRWKGNTTRRGIVADGLAAGHDMLDIRYKANKAANETAANYAQAYAMKYDNPRIAADTATFLAELRKKDAKEAMDYMAAKKKAILDQRHQGFQDALDLRKQKFAEDNAQANRDNALELAGMRGQGKVNAKEAALQKRADSAIFDPSGDPIDTGTGDVAHASSPEKAVEAREKVAAKWNYWKALETYRKDLEESGREFGGVAGIIGQSDRMARLKSEHAALIPAYLKMHGIARLTEEDMKLVGGDVIPPPESWSKSTNPLPAVEAAKRNFRDDMNTEMQTVWGVHDKDWVGAYEASHPETFKPGATEAKGNHQGQTFEPVPTDATGKILTPDEMAAQKTREEAAKPPSADQYVEQQKAAWETRRQANIQAVRANPRITAAALPFPDVGLSGEYHGGRVK